MRTARLTIVGFGVILPFGIRLVPGGGGGVVAYIEGGLVSGILLIEAFNAIAWGSILACSLLYRHPAALWLPSTFGFGYVGWAHYVLDLSASAQAGVGLVVIPIYALPFVAVGGGLGYVLDRWWGRRAAP